MEKKKNNKVIVIDNWLYIKDEDGKIKVKSLNLANYLMNLTVSGGILPKSNGTHTLTGI